MNFLTQDGIALIKKFESCVLHPYQHPGDIPTIGWGTTFYEDNTKVKLSDTPITRERADQLFNYHIKSYVSQVKKSLKTKVNDSQFSALVSYNYNRGYGKFLKSKVLALVNANPSDPAIEQAFLDVSMVNEKFREGILRRRREEYKLYRKK